MSEDQVREAVARIKKQGREFNLLQRWWYGWHYLPGGAAVIAGGLAGIEQTSHWAWAVVASVGAGVVTFLGPLKMAEKYKRAFHQLDEALLHYEMQAVPKGHEPRRWLLTQFRYARSIILPREEEANVEAVGEGEGGDGV